MMSEWDEGGFPLQSVTSREEREVKNYAKIP
jgi:hypothetical protein